MTHARFAFIKANWHADIVDRALDGFLELISTDRVDTFDVPGAFEMPLLARDLAQTERYSAVACAAPSSRTCFFAQPPRVNETRSAIVSSAAPSQCRAANGSGSGSS